MTRRPIPDRAPRTDAAAARAPRGPTAARGRAGLSLVEVLAALTILGVSLLAMASFAVSLTRGVTNEDARGVAAEIAADRLETVKGGTSYDALDSAFAEATPRAVPGNPRYLRQTLIRRVGGGPSDLVDYKVVTVVVTAPRLGRPVRRTTVIGDF